MKRRMTECAIKLALTAVLALAVPLFQGCMDHAIDDVAAYYLGAATLETDDWAVVVSQTTGVVLETLAQEGDYV